MSRRTHKKSRNGCVPCKRRHMRCDENHPICVNCDAAEIRCSFLGQNSPQIVPAVPQGNALPAAASRATTATLTPEETPWQTRTTTCHEQLDAYSLNLTHIELFNNLSNMDFLSPEDLTQPGIVPVALYIKYALTTPYLMHQLLAMSAFHLSIKYAESRMFYREYATGLQTRALSLFNETNKVLEVTSANCAQMFLFSALIGVHLLCDALRYHRDSLEGFIHRFTHCVSIHCGVVAIILESTHLLRETEVGPHLIPSHVFEQTPSTSDPECEALRNLLHGTNLPQSSRKAYDNAIFRLQQVFEAQRAFTGTKLLVPLVFAWPALLSFEFMELLRQQQAEALVVLAHYAMLLHRGRDLWLMGDGGRFLIESICGSLASEWHEYLKMPIAALEETP
ncbi:hypothetical protein EDD37DRAFT_628299 [Exophiala viscosa]|uniref:uncharacterized protein n=1 Tax=Exophiala viscosa TaxID=2486360 RepID=UPI00219F660B|nr:hypothetical protein EDD37DRAFT_628299 [Exophiala viscosa]